MDGKPLLIDAVIGNSCLLATLDRRGELHHLFWPHIDFAQQVGKALCGLAVSGGATTWFSGQDWDQRQEYMAGTAILTTVARHFNIGLECRLEDFCTPGASLLVRRVTVTNTGERCLPVHLIHYAALNLGGSNQLNSVFYHPGSGAYVYYRHQTVCAIGADRLVVGYTCGREGTDGSAFLDAAAGRLGGKEVELGGVDAALDWDLGTLVPGEAVTTSIFWTFAADRREALGLLETARRSGGTVLLAQTAAAWRAWLASGTPLGSGVPLLDRVHERSLITMKLLSDAATGGIIAAPETDPHLRGSGGYGYVWGRDATWITTAFDEAGHHVEAAAFYRWAARTQEPDGSWYQRYYCDGSLAPSWGLLQLDETPSIVFGICHHFVLTHDRTFLATLWPTVRRACDFVSASLDPATGLPSASIDLWEERREESAYASGAAYGGLEAGAYLAREIGDEDRANAWARAAEALVSAIDRQLWSASDERYSRGLLRRIGAGEFVQRRDEGDAVCELPGGLYPVFAELRDRGLDTSLLGLAVPFGAVPPRSPHMKATAAQIARELGPAASAAGGVRRYAGDGYQGGNPWIICTLWYALYCLACGEKETASHLVGWTLRNRTSLDLLPEQVDRDRGGPAWIIPLTWSHAMFVHVTTWLVREGAAACVPLPDLTLRF